MTEKSNILGFVDTNELVLLWADSQHTVSKLTDCPKRGIDAVTVGIVAVLPSSADEQRSYPGS